MDFPEFFETFREAAARNGLTTRDEWIRYPADPVGEGTADLFGYGEFIRFWRLPAKPDALIVHPDAVMAGFITAVLELGWREITARLKFVLHRNAHTNFLCPFPAVWAVSNEDRWADAMVQMVIDQYEGRDIAPVYLPYEFHENVPPGLKLANT